MKSRRTTLPKKVPANVPSGVPAGVPESMPMPSTKIVYSRPRIIKVQSIEDDSVHGSTRNVEPEVEISLNAKRRKLIKVFCKKAMKFTFSQLGLCTMVALYAIAGAFIFQHLEKTNEKDECVQAMILYAPVENATLQRLWDISTSLRSDSNIEFALLHFQSALQSYRSDVLSLNYDGSNCTAMGEDGGPSYQWSFSGALLFSVTVFTTIGYGNIAPRTFWGRLVCIAYAVIGIPLMLLCLANLGEVMAEIFRYTYSHICCCGCCRSRIADKSVSESQTNLTESNPRPRSRHRHLQQQKQQTEDATSPEAWKRRYEADQRAAAASELNPQIYVEDEIDEDDDDDDDDDDLLISVPLTVTMSVIAGYLFMGSILFGVWEGWDWLKAAYYCFITISTIGFGDVVPGFSSIESSQDQLKMFGATIYIVFGMAIMSMAFNLIQEEIVSKFTWMAEKLGIIDKVDEENDEKREPEVAKLTPETQSEEDRKDVSTFELTYPTKPVSSKHVSFPGRPVKVRLPVEENLDSKEKPEKLRVDDIDLLRLDDEGEME